MRPKTSIQKYEIPKNCPFSLPFLTVIEFHRVKKSPLIIGIVDRIKINSEHLFPFSESELSHTFCKLQYNLRTFRLFRGDSSGMDKSSSAIVFYTVMLRKGSQVPQELRGRSRSKDEKGNQGVGGFVSQIFYHFFLSISFFFDYFTLSFCFYTFLPTTFTHTHTHDPQPRPTTSTHDPRPTIFSYTRRLRIVNKFSSTSAKPRHQMI